jgi:hypothetical protein
MAKALLAWLTPGGQQLRLVAAMARTLFRKSSSFDVRGGASSKARGAAIVALLHAVCRTSGRDAKLQGPMRGRTYSPARASQPGAQGQLASTPAPAVTGALAAMISPSYIPGGDPAPAAPPAEDAAPPAKHLGRGQLVTSALQQGLLATIAGDHAVAQAVVGIVVETEALWKQVVGAVLDEDPGNVLAKAFARLRARAMLGRKVYQVPPLAALPSAHCPTLAAKPHGQPRRPTTTAADPPPPLIADASTHATPPLPSAAATALTRAAARPPLRPSASALPQGRAAVSAGRIARFGTFWAYRYAYFFETYAYMYAQKVPKRAIRPAETAARPCGSALAEGRRGGVARLPA